MEILEVPLSLKHSSKDLIKISDFIIQSDNTAICEVNIINRARCLDGGESVFFTQIRKLGVHIFNTIKGEKFLPITFEDVYIKSPGPMDRGYTLMVKTVEKEPILTWIENNQ